MSNFQEKITFIWDLADLLRGPYKRNEYQKVILPYFYTTFKNKKKLTANNKLNRMFYYDEVRKI